MTQLLARAARTGVFCQALLDRAGQPAIRRIQGVLAMAKRFGVARVEQACELANGMEAFHYQFVRRYLEKQSALVTSLTQVDPLIRQLELYRDLIA